jgi:hypothetical protein
MWRELLTYILETLRLKELTGTHETQIKELQVEVRRLTETVVRLEARVEGLIEHERQEREKLVLQLENALLRFDRRLPKDAETPPSLGEGDSE